MQPVVVAVALADTDPERLVFRPILILLLSEQEATVLRLQVRRQAAAIVPRLALDLRAVVEVAVAQAARQLFLRLAVRVAAQAMETSRLLRLLLQSAQNLVMPVVTALPQAVTRVVAVEVLAPPVVMLRTRLPVVLAAQERRHRLRDLQSLTPVVVAPACGAGLLVLVLPEAATVRPEIIPVLTLLAGRAVEEVADPPGQLRFALEATAVPVS
jgi:hypothetical protein